MHVQLTSIWLIKYCVKRVISQEREIYDVALVIRARLAFEMECQNQENVQMDQIVMFQQILHFVPLATNVLTESCRSADRVIILIEVWNNIVNLDDLSIKVHPIALNVWKGELVRAIQMFLLNYVISVMNVLILRIQPNVSPELEQTKLVWRNVSTVPKVIIASTQSVHSNVNQEHMLCIQQKLHVRLA